MPETPNEISARRTFVPIAETMPVGRRRAARPVLRIVLCLVATASATLALAGCGGPTSTPGDLFHAYAESTDVINDEFTGSATGADRLAEFALVGAVVVTGDFGQSLLGARKEV